MRNMCPAGFGTSDCVIVGNGPMVIVDYKHGKGVAVSAEDNSQLKCYALGAYLAFPRRTHAPADCTEADPVQSADAQGQGHLERKHHTEHFDERTL